MAQHTKPNSLDSKLKPARFDTLVNPLENKIDRVDFFIEKADAKLKGIQNFKGPTFPDSLRANTGKYTHKPDSLKRGASLKMDSLSALKLPTSKYTKLLDSLNTSAPMKKLQQAEAGLQKLEKKVNAPVEKLDSKISGASSKVNAKLNELNKEGLDLPEGVTVPGAQGISAPSVNAITGKEMPHLPSASSPNGMPSLPSVNASSNPIQQQIQGITSIPQRELSQIKNAGALGEATKGLTDIKQVSGQAKTYTQEIKSISAGDLSKAKTISKDIEAKASSIGEIKELQSHTQMLDQYKSLAQKGNSPEELKKLAQEQVKKEAVNHFAGKDQLLMAAMDQLSKYKLKYPNATEVKTAFKGVRNEMQGKPWRERLVPGFNLQFHSSGDFSTDFNPFIAYRLSGKWSAGIGWVERVQFHSFISTVPTGRVFGPRAFTDVKWKKGFSLRAEAEHLNVFIPASALADEAGRQWTWNFFAGVKKDYKFTKHIRGNIQVLYNIGHYIHNTSAYNDRLNARMGFEFSVKKRK